jgi:hypothetical protein
MTDEDAFDAFKEAVFFFKGTRVTTELHYSEFEALLTRAAPVAGEPGGRLRGIYVVIGSSLAVRGAVCFELGVDGDGYADPEFSVPLRHLVRSAGPGLDIGCGAIRLACRSQCPLEWHAANLWEPALEGEQNPLRLVQEMVWRNRLGIKIEADVPNLGARGGSGVEPTVVPDAHRELPDLADVEALEASYRRQIEHLIRKHRLELEQQQQISLEQVRMKHDEVQRLKSMLAREQNRTNRLQQLLRGEV